MNASNHDDKILRAVIQIILVLIILVGAAGGYMLLKRLKPQSARVETPIPIPMVRVERVHLKDAPIRIHGEGVVKPWREIKLVPQVAGKVVEISSSLVNGGVCTASQVLVRIDQDDYRLAATLARSRIKDAESSLQLVEQESRVARREWRLLHPGESQAGEEPPPLVVKAPQLEAAQAALEAARADLEKALLQLERTRITAPFAGIISNKSVDAGQYVAPGQVLASLSSTEAAQVVVPLEDADLFWFDVPGFTQKGGQGSPALVHAQAAGEDRTWQGRVDRSEGKVDEATRTVGVVIRVDDPYKTFPPLAHGLFVNVEILGRSIENAALIPRAALREDGMAWIAEPDGTLAFRQVQAARFTRDGVIVARGLEEGDLVVVSPLKMPAQGMKIRVPELEDARKPGGEETP